MRSWWRTNKPPSAYWAAHSAKPFLERFSRHCLLRWFAEASGHGDFLEYHMRFNHPPEVVKVSLQGQWSPGDMSSPALLFLSITHAWEGWALGPSDPPSNSSNLESPRPNSGGSLRTLPGNGFPSLHIQPLPPKPPSNPRAGHGSPELLPSTQPRDSIQYLTSVFLPREFYSGVTCD